jgi:hypothetical protein
MTISVKLQPEFGSGSRQKSDFNVRKKYDSGLGKTKLLQLALFQMTISMVRPPTPSPGLSGVLKMLLALVLLY